ncbi:hypothetical protein PLESTB_000814600 [Pleodorina starrii]|uniref:Ubiquitin-like protease family profile domain-containing protein n=1 Tax=Pleodorina starrii TaxID=330485 RepID=A0A9W6F331_9CHLO|nr:hypothetical protein PLESTM_000130200 [Pleodorina starrii]GLC54015.1 hypothetical protein PLESTB_000814600 [Pleodorina starrii]GLC64679.1 hypothetical protein PLESTF_000191700 [Pleodorina starrii]
MQTKRGRTGETKVLNYGDVLLREEDVSLLEGPYWLNDQVVAFFFEYLSQEGLPAESPTHGSPHQTSTATLATSQSADSVLLVPPTTAFLLMHSPPDVAAEVLAPLKPAQKGLVVLPVNDNDDVDVAVGGSHWSLLIYHRPSNTLRHYDSSPCSCSTVAPAAGGSRRSSWAARKMAEAVGPALGAGDGSAPRLVEVPCMPRQTNGYDCGVYVLAVARAACEWWMQAAGGRVPEEAKQAAEGGQEAAAAGEWEARERGMASWLTPAYVAGLRSEVLEVIRSKAAAAAVGAGGPAEVPKSV